MPRVKRGVNAKKKRKKILELAKGYYGSKHSCYRIAKEQVTKSLTYAYRDRRNKKRDFRKLWIIRINAAARQNGLSYNKFMNGLRLADIEVDRKILSELALNDPQAFSQLAETAKKQLAAS